MVNGGDMGGRRPGQKLSSFSVTCSRLSQYLKEKGGFGELSLGMAAAAAAARPPVAGRGKPETLRTMNLLPGVEALEADEHPAASQDGASDRTMKCPAPSMNLFPQSAGFAPVHTDKKPDLNTEPRTAAAQMTIFYGGKVVVFDNFPAEKARELMTMAGRGCPPPSQHAAATAATVLVTTSDSKPGATAAAAPEEQQKQAQPASSDLSNAPACGCAPSSAYPAKPEEEARHAVARPGAPDVETGGPQAVAGAEEEDPCTPTDSDLQTPLV